MAKVLVTGGAGYIGSHTCIELLQAGHEVIVLDNLSNSSEEALHRVQQLTQKSLVLFRVTYETIRCLSRYLMNIKLMPLFILLG